MLLTFVQRQELTVPGYECSDCHGTGGWDKLELSNFNHSNTGFSLDGIHAIVNCSDCHSGNTLSEKHAFGNTSTSCNSCHLDVHKNNLGDQCSQCHTSMSWIVEQRKFNHEETRFSLMGAHRFINCNACHNDLTSFDVTSTDCYSCHTQEYNKTQNPNHKSVNFDTDCSQCHSLSQGTWTASFDHDLTLFPLKGKHKSEDCSSCHQNNNYDLSTNCDGCHAPSGLAETDYTTAEYDHDTHNIAGFCESCHETSSWDQLIFSHSTFSNESCVFCHSPEYDSAEDPPHANDNISNDCQLCHSTEDWDDGSFAHSDQQTEFVLHGLHIPVDCESCHVNNVYNGLSVNCESSGCHLSTFESTTDPNHTDYGYPAEYCEECHNANGWEPIIFSHQLSLACMTCHMPDYNQADDPVHDEASGFSTTCEDCHTSTDTWEGAAFSHTGVIDGCADCHMDDFYEDHNDGDPTNCEACHSTEDWGDVFFDHEGVDDGCVDCHMDDYNDSDDPDHESWGYPTDCEECHVSTTDWSDASFSHSFPISPNEHQDETTEICASCHPDGNADTFTCFGAGCHTESDMNNEHCEDGPNDCESCNGLTYPSSGVSSDDCVACHPNGDEDDCDGGDRLLIKDKKNDWRNIFLPNQ